MSTAPVVPSASRPVPQIALWKKIPWTFLIILYLLVVHLTGLHMEGVLGFIFIGVSFFVMFAEFVKSVDVSPTVFLVDIVVAVLGVAVSTALMTWLCTGAKEQHSTFFDWFGYAVIVADAIVSPFNSFRTALRNISYDV